MTNQNFKKQFEKTSKILNQGQFSQSGWQGVMVDPVIASVPQTFIYVWDQEKDFLWMCSVDRAQFAKLSKESSLEKPKQHKIYYESVSELIRAAANKLDIYGDWQAPMAWIVSKYAGITQTWKLANSMKDGGHFIVCRYLNPRTGLNTVRPLYIGNTDNLPVDAGEVQALLRDVYETDKAKHPDWFA